MIDWSKVQTAKDKAAAKEKSNRETRLNELLKLLRETDYVVLPDYDKEKPEIIMQREKWRAEVREIENLLKGSEE